MNPPVVTINTPGILYAVSYWLYSVLYISVNERRRKDAGLAAIYIAYLAILCVFMYTTDGIDIRFFIPCMLLIFVTVSSFPFACCAMSPVKAVYFGTRAFILGEFAASMEWQIYYFGLTNGGASPSLTWGISCFLGVHGLTFVIMYLLEKRFYQENTTLALRWKQLVPVLLIALGIYTLSNISYFMKNTPFSSSLPSEMFIIRTMTDLCGVMMLLAYHMQMQDLTIRTERAYLHNMLHMQYENYKVSEESIELVNQKYHDLKHQITLLRQEMDSQTGIAYLDQMEQEIRSYEAQNKTGNKVLDTILTAKSLQCQKENIALTAVADGRELDFIRPMDLSALFGNALDNAIESVRKISDEKKRLIHVSVTRHKGFVRIRVENCYEGELQFGINGLPQTTKGNTRYHGYGIRSIRRTADHYGGSVTINAKDGWFELRILLPVPSESTETR